MPKPAVLDRPRYDSSSVSPSEAVVQILAVRLLCDGFLESRGGFLVFEVVKVIEARFDQILGPELQVNRSRSPTILQRTEAGTERAKMTIIVLA